MSTYSSGKSRLKRSHEKKQDYVHHRIRNSSAVETVRESQKKRRKHIQNDVDAVVEGPKVAVIVEDFSAKKKKTIKREKHHSDVKHCGNSSSKQVIRIEDDDQPADYAEKRAENETRTAAKKQKKYNGHAKHFMDMDREGSDVSSVLNITFQDSLLKEEKKKKKKAKNQDKAQHHEHSSLKRSESSQDERTDLNHWFGLENDLKHTDSDKFIKSKKKKKMKESSGALNGKGRIDLSSQRKSDIQTSEMQSSEGETIEDDELNQTASSSISKVAWEMSPGQTTETSTMVELCDDDNHSDSEESIVIEHHNKPVVVSGGIKKKAIVKSSGNSCKKQSQRQRTRTSDEVVELLHNTWAPSSEHIEELQKIGTKLKKGSWSKDEVEILKSNMNSYLKENNMTEEEASSLIFRSDTDEDKKKHLKSVSKQSDFYRHLGKGISRPLFAIYRRVLRMYNKGNYLGRYTEDEVAELKRLVTIHGNKWSLIGRLMGRSDLSVNHKFIALQGERGSWIDEEVERLKTAVRTLSNTHEGSPLYHHVEWDAVAQLVETRNAEQCRRKWLDSICWQECRPGVRWNLADNLKLIAKVYESGATEETDVDWSELMDADWHNVHSPQWLHIKWSILKKNVPNELGTTFDGVVDYLYHVYGQALRTKSRSYHDQ